MLILRLWNYLNGYVIIIVEGYFLEKFLNICTHRRLRLWNIKWHKGSRLSLGISIEDFKKLRPIAYKAKCRVHIIKKKGFPFLLNKYKNRKAFVVGAFVFIAVFFLISSFIWDVSVTGNEKVSTDVIMERLYANGLKPGALKYKVDLDDTVENMMLGISDLARISISLKGTRILVNVSERVKPPDLINRDEPCDIVALKDGVISSIIAKEGQEMVKIGDTVTKGQILISGTVQNKNPEVAPLMVHSMGSVKARTWYEASVPVEQKLVISQRTGLKKDLYSFVLFTKKIKLFHSKIPYNNSDHVEIIKKLSIGENFVLPLQWIVDEYYEYELHQYNVDIETAKKNAQEKALELAEQQIPKNTQIIKKDTVIIEQQDGASVAKATIECNEDIGITQKIGGM